MNGNLVAQRDVASLAPPLDDEDVVLLVEAHLVHLLDAVHADGGRSSAAAIVALPVVIVVVAGIVGWTASEAGLEATGEGDLDGSATVVAGCRRKREHHVVGEHGVRAGEDVQRATRGAE